MNALKQAAVSLTAAIRREEQVNSCFSMPADDVGTDLLGQARSDVRKALQRLAELTGSNNVPAAVLATARQLIRSEQAHAEAIRKADASLAAARESHANAVANALLGEIKHVEVEVLLGRRRPRLSARLAFLRDALGKLQGGSDV